MADNLATIGVDTHTAAVLSPIGGVVASTHAPADTGGYNTLLAFGRQHAPQQRCWAIEGTGSYGAGLTRFLVDHGELVV